jgi:hypothetical protein
VIGVVCGLLCCPQITQKTQMNAKQETFNPLVAALPRAALQAYTKFRRERLNETAHFANCAN